MTQYVFQYDVEPAVNKDRAGTYHGLKIEAETEQEARTKAWTYLEEQWGTHSILTNLQPDTQPPTE